MNRRELLIRLTDDGRVLLAEHADDVQALEQRMVGTLSERQIALFRSVLAEAWHARSRRSGTWNDRRREPPGRSRRRRGG